MGCIGEGVEGAGGGLSGDDRRGGICLFLLEKSVAVAWTFPFPTLFEVCFSILPQALCYLSPTSQSEGRRLRIERLCLIAEGTQHDVVRA